MKTGFLRCFLFAPAALSFAAELPPELKELPASTFSKPVERTESGDERFAIAVGFKSPAPVDWTKYKDEEGGGYSVDPDAGNPLLANFLVDVKKDRAVALLEGKHFGTRKTYNHESCQVAWSEKGKYLIEMQSWKWHTSHAALHHLNADGSISARLNLLELASSELSKLLKEKHGIDAKSFDARYGTALSEPEVDDEGKATLHATAEVPKSTEDPSLSALIKFTAKPDGKGALEVRELVVTEEE